MKLKIERYIAGKWVKLGAITLDTDNAQLAGDKGIIRLVNAKMDSAMKDGEIYSEHAHSPSFILDDPLSSLSQFKSLLSTMGMRSHELKSIEPAKAIQNEDTNKGADIKII